MLGWAEYNDMLILHLKYDLGIVHFSIDVVVLTYWYLVCAY